jgi:hypothetical protein
MKRKFVLRRKLRLAFGSAVLGLLVVGAVSYNSMVDANESDLWARHTGVHNLQGEGLRLSRWRP